MQSTTHSPLIRTGRADFPHPALSENSRRRHSQAVARCGYNDSKPILWKCS